jgi:hypothetical protein
MFGRARILLVIGPCAVALPAAAQAPASTTAFDGIYTGVSMTFEGTMRGLSTSRTCAPSGKPGRLTIANGVVQTSWGGSTADGSINPQGVLVMHAQSGARFDGQADGHGIVTGRFSGYCSYQIVWQKKG